jgi:hypothetical protein
MYVVGYVYEQALWPLESVTIDGFTRSEPPGNEKKSFEISSLCMYICMYVCTYVLWHVDTLLSKDQETNN